MTNLSVNLNKVALLRNQRDVGYPDVAEHGQMILDAGAQGLTVHPRPDERHIRKSDVPILAALIEKWNADDKNRPVEFNIEGYPSDDFIDLVTTHPCHQVTLVPDDPNQRTSDHGWDVVMHRERLKEVISHLKSHGRRVSIFLDPVLELLNHAAETGADHIELYTGPYAEKEVPLETYAACAQKAEELGIGVNAGHDLSLDNLAPFIAALPTCAEVSIGQAITADALKMGWNAAIIAYLTAIEYGHKSSKETDMLTTKAKVNSGT
ncbi:MAG: pyridoxine 5'-phosphate synthase [Alphaproteobacteria bacterium]|nr:pyridoxine 5'-phosphate synthase [Alphaproteobacteria bacterium]